MTTTTKRTKAARCWQLQNGKSNRWHGVSDKMVLLVIVGIILKVLIVLVVLLVVPVIVGITMGAR